MRVKPQATASYIFHESPKQVLATLPVVNSKKMSIPYNEYLQGASKSAGQVMDFAQMCGISGDGGNLCDRG